MRYADFTIRARDWQAGDFQVEVLDSPQGEMRAPATVRYDEADWREPLDKLKRKQLRLPELIALGKALASLLLPEPVRQMLRGSLAVLGERQGLRLRLALNDPRIAALPWEYLYLASADGEQDWHGFLALNPQTAIVRYEALPQAPRELTARLPLRVLVGFAAPRELQPLDWATERAAIENALGGLPGLQVDFIENLTRPQFEGALTNTHLFHFAGHGSFAASEAKTVATPETVDTRHLTAANPTNPTNAAALNPAGTGVLAFEDEQGEAAPFDADKLSLQLRAAGVRVAVLGACETGRRDDVNVWSGIAPALMRAGLAGVVAMQARVYDQAAVHFARRFYQTLAEGLSLEEAVLQGRLAIFDLGEPWALDFGVPVLYARADDSVVFPEFAAETALAELPALDFATHIQTATRDFTGRAWVFQALNEWLSRADASSVFLLTGEPGAGKTAIAARLAQFSDGTAAPPPGSPQMQPGWLSGEHFCSARDGRWVRPHAFVKSLARQLAQHHVAFRCALLRLDFSQLDRLSAEEAFTRAVHEPLAALLRARDGQPVVILVDALDEALDASGVGIVQLLAGLGHLPPGLRLILTSRPVTPVETAFLHCESLSLSDQQHQSDAEQDVRGYLNLRFNQAPHLTAALRPEQQRAAETQITAAAAGNLQYLGFLLDEMARGKRSLTDFVGLPAGLDALYHASLRRVAGPQAQDWVRTYQPLLGVLAAAQAGLTLAQLQNFTTHSESEVWEGLGNLWQFIRPIQPDGETEERFQLYHQSLADFLQHRYLVKPGRRLRNDFYTPVKEWHERIANFYWTAHRDKWADCDEYGLLYLPAHLRELDDYARLCTLVDQHDWYEAKLALTGHDAAYLADLGYVWEMARQRDVQTLRQGQPAACLGRAIRCALAMSSLGGLAQEIPPALLRALVAGGVWSLEDATAAAQRMPDLYRKAQAFANLALVAPTSEQRAELAQAGLQATPELDAPLQAEMRLQLAQFLPDEERERAQRETFAEILTLDWKKTDALVWVAALLPETLLPEAFAATLTLDDRSNQELVLAALAPRLPSDLLQQALDLMTGEPARCAPVLWAAQLRHLPETERGGKARLILDQIQGLQTYNADAWRDVALRMLVPHLDRDLLSEAATLARRLNFHSKSLPAFVRRFAELGQMDEAFNLYRFLAGNLLAPSRQQAEALRGLLEVLSPAQLPALREVVQEIANPFWRAEALGLLACSFPDSVENILLLNTLEARALKDAEPRDLLLATLAAHLPEEFRRKAFARLSDIQYHLDRVWVLELLAPHLPADLLDPALTIATHLDKDRYEARAVKALAPYLPEALLEKALEHSWYWKMRDQIALAPTLAAYLPPALRQRAITEGTWCWEGNTDERTAFLCAFSRVLPEEMLPVLLAEARAMPGSEARYGLRLRAAILPQLSAEEQPVVLAEALDLLRQFPHGSLQEPALPVLAVYLASQRRFADALSLIGRLDMSQEQTANALAEIVPLLDEEYLPQARTLALNLHDWPATVRILALLKTRLANDPIHELTDRVVEHASPTDKFKWLCPLLPHLPAERRLEVLPHLLNLAEGLADDEERKRAMGALGPAMLAVRISLPLERVYALCDSVLRASAKGSRKDLIETLRLLTPMLVALGDVPVAAEVFNTVQDVGHWWQ